MVEPNTSLVPILRTFDVTLSGIAVTPQFINPATLALNAIIDDTWPVDPEAQIGITTSNFRYANGVQITSEDETVCFSHSDPDLRAEDFLSADIANRFASTFSISSWFAVSLEFSGAIHLPGPAVSEDQIRPSPFMYSLRHNSATPHLHTSASYHYSDYSLTVELSEIITAAQPFLNFSARNYRVLSDEDRGDLEPYHLEVILANWRSHWGEATSAVSRLAEATTALGIF